MGTVNNHLPLNMTTPEDGLALQPVGSKIVPREKIGTTILQVVNGNILGTRVPG